MSKGPRQTGEWLSTVSLEPLALQEFATRLMAAGGIELSVADAVATHLVDAERLGRETHGVCNVPVYVAEVKAGRMSGLADLELQSGDGVLLVNGRNASGIWAVGEVLDRMFAIGAKRPVTTAVISAVHHTGCMTVYLQQAIERGFVLLMCSSNPVARQVLPYGAREPLLSTNPIAFGSPAGDSALMLDMATSMVAGSLVRDYREENQELPGAWVADDQGQPSRDPHGPGLLPLGAPDHGYKGTGLALMVEALTQGLSGWGRSSQPQGWQLAVFLQVFNPAFFRGGSALERELGHTLKTVRGSIPADPAVPVRTPGDRAAEHYAQSRHLVRVSRSTLAKLEALAGELGVAVPAARQD